MKKNKLDGFVQMEEPYDKKLYGNDGDNIQDNNLFVDYHNTTIKIVNKVDIFEDGIIVYDDKINSQYACYMNEIMKYKNIKYDNNNYICKYNNYFSRNDNVFHSSAIEMAVAENSMINGIILAFCFKMKSKYESNLALNGSLVELIKIRGNIKNLVINGASFDLQIIPHTVKEMTINGYFSDNMKLPKYMKKLVINGCSPGILEIPKSIKKVVFNGFEISKKQYLDHNEYIANFLFFVNGKLKKQIEITREKKLNDMNITDDVTEIIILGKIENMLFSFPKNLKNLIIQGVCSESIFVIPKTLSILEINGVCEDNNHFIFEETPEKILITLIGCTGLYHSDMNDYQKITEMNDININNTNFIKKIKEPYIIQNHIDKKCKVNKETIIIKGCDHTIDKIFQ